MAKQSDDKEKELNIIDRRKFNGGYREGAGRKPFVELTQVEREDLKRLAQAEFWLEACRDIAIPYVFQLVGDPNAGERVRFNAAQEIINRALGKPKERHEVSGPDGEAITTNQLLSPEVIKIREEYEARAKKLLLD